MLKSKLAAGLSAAFVTTLLMGAPAQASCQDTSTCSHQMFKKHRVQHASAKSSRKLNRVASVRKLSSHRSRTSSALVVAGMRNRAPVVAMIKSMAPRYGVPTWFALRIAYIESGYNPRARGAAGEYGVFQLKCATARGIGFRGSCGSLLNASTNVQYGLKHLSLAVRSSRGNLRLAASKHNGGLGRKSLVRGYVSRVF